MAEGRWWIVSSRECEIRNERCKVGRCARSLSGPGGSMSGVVVVGGDDDAGGGGVEPEVVVDDEDEDDGGSVSWAMRGYRAMKRSGRDLVV